jgi:hypothetical protein
MKSNCFLRICGTHLRKTLGYLALLLIVSGLPRNVFPTVGAQRNEQAALTEEEQREAVQVSVAFTKRLSQTTDMRVVMDELFLPDSVERYLATEKSKASRAKLSYVFFSSGIFVDVSLLNKPALEDWRRFYIATNNFMFLGLIHAIRRNADFEVLKPTDMYPREVIELLDHDPMLGNLIQKKSSIRNFKSFEEMQSATASLEQAAALIRKALPGFTDLEKAVVQMAMNQASVKRPMKEEDLEKARAELIKPRLEVSDGEFLGFPPGTRLIWVPTLSFHQLVLVRVDGKLRVVWAYPNPGG